MIATNGTDLGIGQVLGNLETKLSRYAEMAQSIQKSIVEAEHYRQYKLEALAAWIPATQESETPALIADLQAALADKQAATARVKASKLHLEEAKALVYLNGVEGKNEAERSARLQVALRDDADYQNARADLDQAEQQEDEASNRARIAQAQLDATKDRTRLVTAVIHFLAS